jgi:RimJ/RimL family protein N-acetyltransferase
MTPPSPTPEIFVPAVVLEGHGVRLEPMRLEHEEALRLAAADGKIWQFRYTTVPEPEKTRGYIETALAEAERGIRRPFVVRELSSGQIVGSTSYHDIVPVVRRVEIGYTWYAQSWQRTHVNSACKFLLMTHAFEMLECNVVGWRTDILNLKSQAAIERLGARKDGVIRGQALRRDGTLRDTVMYSITAEEWRGGIKARLEAFVRRRTAS